jgi:hypothetical protein
MINDDNSRNVGARPGYTLNDTVELTGWDDRSTWGYDDGIASFYAQLWRNPGDTDAPDIWLSGVDPRYPWPGCLALAIVDATGRDPLSVIRALGIAAPAPSVRPSLQITCALEDLSDPGVDTYAAGQAAVYRWALSGGDKAPGSWLPWNGQPPTPEQVDAERHMITARAYQQCEAHTRAFVGGADEALTWLLTTR